MAKQKKQRLMRSIRKTALTGRVETANARTGQRETMNVKDLKTVLDLSADQCREMAIARVTHNLRETKHTFHHKTAVGVIVTPDPTLEYLLSRLSEKQRKQFHDIYASTPEQEAQAPKASPVDRKFYGRDMYEGLV